MLICWSGAERNVWTVPASRRDARQLWLLDYLAERKSWSDLVGSIKSARYRQQKGAMMATGLRHLLYIVEGHEQCLSSARSPSASQHAPSLHILHEVPSIIIPEFLSLPY